MKEFLCKSCNCDICNNKFEVSLFHELLQNYYNAKCPLDCQTVIYKDIADEVFFCNYKFFDRILYEQIMYLFFKLYCKCPL